MDGFANLLVETELTWFSANDYRGRPDAPAFRLVERSLPVVVSAAHAVTHWREGRMKPSDDYTGALALAVAGICGCHAIVATNSRGHDPNWDPFETSPYKQALCEFVREHGVALVIDLHGMPAASPDAIEIGSADGATVAVLPGADVRTRDILQEELAPYLRRYDRAIALNGRHAARGENTVTRTVSRECGIAALQLEINSRFRVPSGAGTHVPKDDPMPFSADQLPEEWVARSNPDPACVEATVRAIARVIDELAG